MRQHRRQADTQRLQIGQQGADQRHRLALTAQGREAVATTSSRSVGVTPLAARSARLIGELPPEIRAPQRYDVNRRGAVHRQGPSRPSAASGATNCWLANG